MNRQEMINDIALWVENCNKKTISIDLPVVVEHLDLWLNDSNNGEGEGHKVIGIGYENDELGLFVGDYDFYTFTDLSDDEVEYIYENLN